MPHPLVQQLRFARNEFVRCLQGVTLPEAYVRIGQMNCISWTIGHMANQEHTYWVFIAQEKNLMPDLRHLVGTGSPASTPKLDDMWHAWREATANADVFLDTLTTEKLQEHFEFRGRTMEESIGTMLQRNLYHYWFHLGEAHAIRQQLGHKNLPQFVGNFAEYIYTPEGNP